VKTEVFESNPILKLSFDFALMVINYCEKLEAERKFVVSRQKQAVISSLLTKIISKAKRKISVENR